MLTSRSQAGQFAIYGDVKKALVSILRSLSLFSKQVLTRNQGATGGVEIAK